MSLLAQTYFLSCKTTMLVLHYCPLNALDRAHLASRQCMLLFMIYFMFAYNMYVTYDRLYYQTTCGSWEDSVSIEKIIYFQSQMSFNIGALHFCFHVPKKDAMKFANQAWPFFSHSSWYGKFYLELVTFFFLTLALETTLLITTPYPIAEQSPEDFCSPVGNMDKCLG